MLIKIILLGIIQGITEFLPVSSTAHLVLAEKLLNVSEESFGVAFDVALHLGTTLALILFFWKTWLSIKKSLLINLIVATIPAVLMGFFLEKDIKIIFRSPFWIAIFLILFSFVFYLAEIVTKKNKEIKQMKIIDALVIGINQAIALLPGVSRSGITISGGLLLNLKREEAGKFAFLLSTPVIFGAFLKEHAGLFSKLNFGSNDCWLFIMGTLTSFIVGFLTLKLFLKYLNKGSLMPFIIYRIILGIIIILLIIK